MTTEFYPGQLDQGKRIIKRIRKLNVLEGKEYEFLLGALRQATMHVALTQARQANHSPEVAMMIAQEARARVQEVPAEAVPGRRLYMLMVANGSRPGRVKSEVDGLLDMLFSIATDSAKDDQWIVDLKGKLERTRVVDFGDDHLPGGRHSKIMYDCASAAIGQVPTVTEGVVLPKGI